jgi:hypothetical protein
VAVDLAQVQAVIDRIAADVDELARAQRVQDLTTAAVLSDRRAERRRLLAEPHLEFQAFCARKGLPASSTLQLERAWDAWQAERYQRGETGLRPGYTDNPFRHADHPPAVPAFRKLDAITVLTARLLPVSRHRPGDAGQYGGCERRSYSRQPRPVIRTANVVTYISVWTLAVTLNEPIPGGAPGSSVLCAALRVGQKSPWDMPLHKRQANGMAAVSWPSALAALVTIS